MYCPLAPGSNETANTDGRVLLAKLCTVPAVHGKPHKATAEGNAEAVHRSRSVCVFDRSLSVQKLVLGFRQMSLVNQTQSFACVMEL